MLQFLLIERNSWALEQRISKCTTSLNVEIYKFGNLPRIRAMEFRETEE
jgi:hypothetical protein